MSVDAGAKTGAHSKNVDVVHQMIDCYCTMNADGLRPLLRPDAKHSAPGSDFGTDIEGAAQIVEYFRTNVFPSFHDVRFEVVHLYEDAPQSVVTVEWRSHLKPKTGKNYSNTGVFVIVLKDGKIDWVREYFDTEKSHANV
jgi:ketosteroid isomerase-like protein